MAMQVKPVSEPLELGEGPHWDTRAQALYYVNIHRHSIHKYDPATGLNTSTKLDGYISFIIPVDGVADQFVVSLDCKFLVVEWDGADGSPAKVVKELGEVDKDVPTKTQVNDGKVDPRGRLFTGTLGADLSPETRVGSIYRLDKGTITKVEQGIALANGLSWDLNEKAFYYVDSFEFNIRRYDYDVDTGDITNLRYIFDFKKNGIEGLPDGHTIDTEGNLWVAMFGGSCVIQVDPRTGKLLRKVTLPAVQVTSATFGGPDLDVLYVTSGSKAVTTNFFKSDHQEPPGGCVFEVTGLGVKGHPNRSYKL